MSLVWGFLSLVAAMLVAALGELVSDEIRARLDRVPFALLAAAARRLPADQRADLYEQAWLPELHYVLRGDEAKPITRLVHGSRYAMGLWFAASAIGRELDEQPTAGGHRLDLLALRPAEFEQLVRQLFEQIGLMPSMTQLSPDGGIDLVVYDDRPVLGGACCIQLKRYAGAVGVEALRELAGSIEGMHAAKGILVTTARVTQAGREFAARYGRIEIIDGDHLKAMLQEHLGLDAVITFLLR